MHSSACIGYDLASHPFRSFHYRLRYLRVMWHGFSPVWGSTRFLTRPIFETLTGMLLGTTLFVTVCFCDADGHGVWYDVFSRTLFFDAQGHDEWLLIWPELPCCSAESRVGSLLLCCQTVWYSFPLGAVCENVRSAQVDSLHVRVLLVQSPVHVRNYSHELQEHAQVLPPPLPFSSSSRPSSRPPPHTHEIETDAVMSRSQNKNKTRLKRKPRRETYIQQKLGRQLVYVLAAESVRRHRGRECVLLQAGSPLAGRNYFFGTQNEKHRDKLLAVLARSVLSLQFKVSNLESAASDCVTL